MAPVAAMLAAILAGSPTFSATVAAAGDTTPPDTFIVTHPDDPTMSTNAVFTLRATDNVGVAFFSCVLDGAGVDCHAAISGLSVGQHTFSAAAQDTSGNADPSPASFTWTVVTSVDTTPPDTFITTHPDDPTSSTSAAFGLSGSDDVRVASFSCVLDGVGVDCGKAISGLALGQHTFSAVAHDASGNSDPSPASFTWTITVDDPAPSTVLDYIPLPPARLADTRASGSTIDGAMAAVGRLEVNSTFEVTVAGRGGVPADAIAAALNVTAVDPAGAGHLAVFPCGQRRSTASSVNFGSGATVASSVFAGIGVGGKVCIFASQRTQLVVDVAGAFPTGSRFVPTDPARVLDTRSGSTTVDGQQRSTGQLALGSITVLHLAGRAGVPAAADSVVLNLTASESVAPGFVTVYPCDTQQPTSSNLNFVPGVDVSNLVVAKTDPSGDVCLFTSQPTQLIADVNGHVPAHTTLGALVPSRLIDTRTRGITIDGLGAGAGKVAAGETTPVHVTGRARVHATATTVIINVTVTDASGAGYATVYPCGIEPPLASSINFAPGQTVSNNAIVKVGAGGDICVHSSQSTHLIVDVLGDVVG